MVSQIQLRILRLLAIASLLLTSNHVLALSCEGFQALIGFAYSSHYEGVVAETFHARYRKGLKTALDAYAGKLSIPSEKYFELTTPEKGSDWLTCRDVDHIVEYLHANDLKYASQSLFLGRLAKTMIQALDPHSDYYLPYEWTFIDRIQTSASIGLRLTKRNSELIVEDVFPDGPADGLLQAGDRITAIGDQNPHDLQALSNLEISAMTSGRLGNGVHLQLTRAGKALTRYIQFDFDDGSRIRRAEILPGHVGLIVITEFRSGVSKDILRAVNDLMKKGARSLIIDLRFNPGGSIEEAKRIVDLFVDYGVAVALKNREGMVRPILLTEPGMLTEMPVAILLNDFSASAAEIVAGALVDHLRAFSVGNDTFGKGTAQTVMPPKVLQALVHQDIDGGLRLTEYVSFTPKGRSLQLVGHKPIVLVLNKRLETAKIGKRKEAEISGNIVVFRESDYHHAIGTQATIESLIPKSTSELSLNTLIDHLTGFQAEFSEPEVDDDQLLTAIDFLSSYQDQCHNFRIQTCGI